uniref:MD-2-related lipid-recognition domain-containing protein n=1 Tax=Piliocolobus tephrosceles TaxID=591936 RepID=A0A8C9H0M4_9PRIM
MEEGRQNLGFEEKVRCDVNDPTNTKTIKPASLRVAPPPHPSCLFYQAKPRNRTRLTSQRYCLCLNFGDHICSSQNKACSAAGQFAAKIPNRRAEPEPEETKVTIGPKPHPRFQTSFCSPLAINCCLLAAARSLVHTQPASEACSGMGAGDGKQMVACALSFPSLQPHLGCSEEPREALTMKGFTAALFLGTLIFPSCSGDSGGRAWPTHTVCSDSGLEVLYQSCEAKESKGGRTHSQLQECSQSSRQNPTAPDPLQDFGFSIEKCSKQLKSNINIRFGIILREDIKELFLDLALMSQGSSVLNFSYPICEVALPKFSFCGRRKGEQIYYAGPVNNPEFTIPQGEYQVLLELYTEKRSTVACANATIMCS